MVRVPQQGDIVWANLNPKKGHEQQGFRPLIVLSNDLVSQHTNVVIVAPISTTKRRLPFYVELPKDYETQGTVLLDQLVTIDYTVRHAEYKETVSSEFLEQLLDISRRIFSK